jgi:hypothetical protein
MTTDRIKEIQDKTAFPDSVSVCQALLQVWNECEQDNKDKKYTFNQITDAIAMAREINGKETYYKYSMEDIINSINKQD